jgi:hypothetical protein
MAHERNVREWDKATSGVRCALLPMSARVGLLRGQFGRAGRDGWLLIGGVGRWVGRPPLQSDREEEG